MSPKPRVLITADQASWIIGQMAMEIIAEFSDRYEFWFFTDKLMKMRPDLLRQLAPTLSFVFPLTDHGFRLVEEAIGPAKLPSVFWMHHITDWTDDMRRSVAEADEVVVCTPEWKERLVAEAAPAAPVTVVPHGVDATVFRRVPAERAAFGMPREKFVVGFVGSKRSHDDGGRKGLDTLDRVLESVRAATGNLHVSFLGMGWDAEVQRLNGRGISANYVGFIPKSRLAAFYSSVDAYLMTSRVEGGPCTVLEAMACQTPVVATRVGLVPDVIQDGINGFSAEIEDAAKLSSALEQLGRSSALREEMGKAARRTVVETRSWPQVLKALDEPLRRAQGKAKAAAQMGRDTGEEASKWRRAVTALDGALSVLLNCKRGVMSPLVGLRMLASCWENLGVMDVLRGMQAARPALLARRSLRSHS